jgi:F-type H+-transporting ATPase subunit gamma
LTGGRPEYEFLPSAESILEEVVPTSFKVQIVQVLFGCSGQRTSRANDRDEGCHRKRRRHDQATIDDLQPRPPKQITGEIMEIIGGVEALGEANGIGFGRRIRYCQKNP